MKTLALFLAFALAGFAAEEKAPPQFPTTITLSSGAVLRNTSPIRWTSDAVVVKHAGGADPVRFVNMAEASRKAVLAAKPGTAPAATTTAATPAAATSRTLSGQVFVTTQGAGAYKFSGATVTAYPQGDFDDTLKSVRMVLLSQASVEDEARVWAAELAKRQAIGSATTNAAGQYSMSVAGPVFLVCSARRLAGRVAEANLWIVPVAADATTADLNGSNCRTQENDVVFTGRRR